MYNQHAHFLLCAHLRVSLWQEVTFFIISCIVFKCCFQMIGIKCFISVVKLMLDSVTLFKKNLKFFKYTNYSAPLLQFCICISNSIFFHVIHLLNHLQLSKHKKGFPFFHYVIDICFLR